MKPFSVVKVYRWKSAKEKQLYIFNAEEGYAGHTDDAIYIKETIYQDDNVEDAVNKIGLFIQDKSKFYVWEGNKPLLFDIKESKWRGYNVNPFKCFDYTSSELDEPISYDYTTSKLFMCKTINIVFENDLPRELQKNKYYFPKMKTEALKYYQKHDEKLGFLKKQDVKNVTVLPEYYKRITLKTKLTGIVLANLFDNMTTSKYVDMIQWVNDTSKILYKLSKTHRIHRDYMGIWTNVDRINQINVINIYSVVQRNSYCKVTVQNDGNITFNYILESRAYIKWDDVMKHKKKLMLVLQNAFKQPIKAKELSLNIGLKIEVHNTSFKTLIKKIGEAIDVFHVVKNEKNSLSCTYKRCSNYGQNVDIYDYIRSRINLGISKQEIIEELHNLGITGNTESMIDDEINVMEQNVEAKDRAKINLQENGTIVTMVPYSHGYDISITNIPNKVEFQYLLYWLSRILYLSIDTTMKRKSEPVPKKPSTKSSSSASSRGSLGSRSYSSQESVDHGSIDFDLDSMGGGWAVRVVEGAGKAGPNTSKNNNFINMLQQADKDLFGENYARDKCQNPSQPIVMSKSQKEALEQNNQMHFDNVIEYGSRPEIQNYYACPRLWCPQSKVPLSVDDPNAKCPIADEEPIKLFWDNDKDKKRYVKLIKPNEKGMCVPCCMKKEPKPDEINKCKNMKQNTEPKKTVSPKQESHNYIDENYIMNQSAPIPVARYGSIPEYLHMVLMDKKIPYEACTKTLNKSHACFVRKGIKNSKYDSIILAIFHILGFKTKQEFMKDIRKKLDLITFLSLDNGFICKQFMNMREIIPAHKNKLLKEFNVFKNNTKICNINTKEANVSRILNIYYGYKRFMDYLGSNDFVARKDPVYLYSLINALYDMNLLIWEKMDKTDEIYMHCPSNITIDFNPSLGMILKEGPYYEPLELKMRSTPPLKSIKLNDYPKLKEMIAKCKGPENKHADIYKNLYTLNNWVKSKVLANYKSYAIKNILINTDLTINKLLTGGNILLEFDTISIAFLPNMVKDFGIQYNDILFYDDVIGIKHVKVLKNDLETFAEKCHNLSIGFQLGRIVKESDKEYNTELMIEPSKLLDSLMLHTNNHNEFYDSLGVTDRKTKKWYELQKMVANNIIKKYSDSQLAGINMMNRQEKVKKLLESFVSLKLPATDLKKVKIILEEIPIESHETVTKWLSNMIIHTKYDYFSRGIQENKSEFIFSQNALVRSGVKHIPEHLLAYHKSLPNISVSDTEVIDIPININRNDTNNVEIQLPKIFEGKLEPLKTKWIMHKKSKWTNMCYIKCDYDKNTMPEFVEWLAAYLGMRNISYSDILAISRQKYFDYMNDKEVMFEILQDPFYYQAWMEKIKRKIGTIQLFWDNVYSKLSQDNRSKYINEILDSKQLYPTDFDIQSISEIFNINILMIHRAKYGKFDAGQVRGDIDDLKISSTLYASKQNMGSRPLIILHKTYEKNNSVYNLIVDKTITPQGSSMLYLKYDEVNTNIKMLVEAHLEDLRNQ